MLGPGRSVRPGRRRALGLAGVLLALVAVPVDPAGAAVPVADAAGPYTIAEGDDLVLDGSGSTDGDGDPLGYRWDLDGDGQYDDATGAQPTIPWSTLAALGVDDDGTFPIALEVDDGTAASVAGASLTITDTPPTITVSGPSTAAVGHAVTIDIVVDEPGADTTSAVIVDWGDGTMDTLAGTARQATHTYAAGGMLRPIQVGVTDEHGHWTDDRLVVPFYDTTEKVRSFDADSGGDGMTFGVSGAINRAYAAAVGPDGDVYVTGLTSGGVERFDAETGASLGTFVAAGSGGLADAKGLVFGPDGDLLVSSTLTGEILRYDGTTGAFVGVFVPSGDLQAPSGLTFGPDGVLYVADQNLHDILRFDGDTGAFLGAFAFLQASSVPAGLTFGPDGHLYVAANGRNRIDRRDGTTGADIGNIGAGSVMAPTGLRFGTDGALWVAAYGTETIERWDWQNDLLLDVRITEPVPAGPMQFTFVPDHTVQVVDAIVVNSTGDSNDQTPGDGVCDTGGQNSELADECTLRAALAEVQSAGGPATILFDLPASDPNEAAGVWTISPTSMLPVVPSDVVVDATSQPGWTGSPVVVVDGTATTSISGIQVSGDRSRLSGLAIAGYDHLGVLLQGADNALTDSYVGLLADGVTRLQNGQSGVLVMGPDAVIADNVISGNVADGVLIQAGGDRAVVVGNFLGVDATGLVGMGNGEEGLQASDVDGMVVGRPGEGNVVGDNGLGGIRTLGGVTNASIQANLVGVGSDGTTPLGNNNQGINVLGADTDILIGGAGAGEGNVVRHSQFEGVKIESGGQRVTVRGNEIDDNDYIGLDLDGNGVLLNDAGDGDGGSNGGQNYPVVTSARLAGGDVEVAFTLDSVASSSYVVDVYSSPLADVSGHGEGAVYHGSTSVETDATGAATATATVPGLGAGAGEAISLTATDALGNTSEFSAAVVIDAFVVNSTGDAGDATPGDDICDTGGTNSDGADECTLRAAIEEANAGGVAVTIAFAIPASDPGHRYYRDDSIADSLSLEVTTTLDDASIADFDPDYPLGGFSWWSIEPATLLPAVTVPVTIDGGSQPGAVAGTTVFPATPDLRPVIEIDGSAIASGALLDLAAGPSLVRDVILNGAGGAGGAAIRIQTDPSGSTVQGSIIGLDPTGSVIRPAGGYGIDVNAAGTLIGGTAAGEGNIVAGDSSYGLWLDATSVVQGNLLGTDITGTRDLRTAATNIGVATGNGSVVGGSATGAGNLISGHSSNGIWVNSSPDDLTIQGNRIGTNLDATATLGGSTGINVNGTNVQIGGTAVGAGNVIGGQSMNGVLISTQADLVTIEGNDIGVDPTGAIPLPNATGVSSNAPSVRIGGTTPAAGNVIVNSTTDNVRVGSSTDTAIVGNSILASGNTTTALGIDLGTSGVTPNDAGDLDTGANDLLNHPEVTDAVAGAGTVTVDLDLDVPAGDYRIEVFTNPSGAHSTGYGEGEVFEAATTVTHTGSGSESFQVAYTGSVGDVITLTATEDLGAGNLGATSEFSAAATVDGTVLVVNSTGDAGDLTPGDGLCDTGGTNSEGADECTLRAAVEESNASAGDDRIEFDIPLTDPGHVGGHWTIAPATDLPVVTDAVALDARTQPGWTGDPLIALDGSSGLRARGIEWAAGGGTLAGLRFLDQQTALEFTSTSSDVLVTANWFGTDETGLLRRRTFADGLIVLGSRIEVRDNLLGGSDGGAVVIADTAVDITVAGNTIGLGRDGSTPLTVDADGVLVSGGATGTTIGGSDAADRNVIANVASAAVAVDGVTTSGTVVSGNWLGFDTTGGALGGQGRGVRILDAVGVVIGGDGVGEGNRINATSGFGSAGVLVVGGADDVAVLGNSIVGSDGLGIDLASTNGFNEDGVTSNDVGDSDLGPNGHLNTPEVTSVTEAAGLVTVDFDLDVPAGAYRIEAFTNPSGADPTGSGEGEQFEQAISIVHPVGGVASYQLSFTGSGEAVALTATEGNGSYGATSEFSIAVTASPPAVVVNSTGDAGDLVPGDGVCDTGGQNSELVDECTLRAAIEETAAGTSTDIGFDLPLSDPNHSAGVWTITPGSLLPQIGASTVLDATTQSGWTGVPVVVVDGASVNGASPDGLRTGGADVTVRGLSVVDWKGDGFVTTHDRTTVESSWFGVLPDATVVANAVTDLRILGTNDGVVIGGATAAQGNVFAAAGSADAVRLETGPTNTMIRHNHFGVDAAGTSLLGGVVGELVIVSGASSATEIRDNQFGGAPNAAVAVIDDAVDTTVAGNVFGTDDTGTIDLAVAEALFSQTTGRVTFGGTGAGDGNLVRNTVNAAVASLAGHPDDLVVLGNSITASGGLGIDLENDGVTTNDGFDATLPRNRPVLVAATASGGSLDVDYRLDVPAGTYRVEFFANPSGADPTGSGEGEIFLGADTFVHTGGGLEDATVSGLTGTGGDVITATVTADLGGGFWGPTSEFSVAITATGDGVIVNSTGDADDLTPGDGVCDTGGVNSEGADECTLRAAITEANASAGIDTIAFALPTSDPNHQVGDWWQILPATSLPAISSAVTIDATTQPEYVDEPVVLLSDGATVSWGLEIGAADTTVRGFAITSFSSGVRVRAARATIVGNWFGRTPGGTTPGNSYGIWIESTGVDSIVGSGTSGDANVFAQSSSAGLYTAANRVVVQGNSFGRLPSGTVTRNTRGIDIAASDVLIGGTGAGEGNEFAGMVYSAGLTGIAVRVLSGTGSAIVGNRMVGNQANIDLGGDGITVNDGNDVDTGPNDLLNHPTLVVASSVPLGGGTSTVTVDATLDAPAGDYRIEVFQADEPGVNGRGDADVLVHAETITHTGSGAEVFSLSWTGPDPTFLAATATEDLGAGDLGSTSEIGPATPLVTGNLTVNSTGDAPDADLGDGVCSTGALNSQGAPECTFRAAVEHANHAPGVTIVFAIPETETGYDAVEGFWTIQQSGDWERLLADGTEIDGTTQPGWDGSRPLVFLRDDAIGTDTLALVGHDITIRAVALGLPGDDGVQLEGDRSVLDGVWIGLDPAGGVAGHSSPSREGIIVYSGSIDGLVVASRIANLDSGVISNSGTIGLTITGTEIFGNRNGGLVFDNAGTVSLLGNSIHDNVGLGIELGDNDGLPRSNDLGDVDSGANDLLNHPVVTAARPGTGTVDVRLDVPAGDYRIEFFTNTAADPTGYGEGETFVAGSTITHAGSGEQTFTLAVPTVVGDIVTATATEDLGGSYGSTSEFSRAFVVGSVLVNSTGDLGDANPGDDECSTGATIADGAPECTLRAAIEEANGAGVIERIVFDIPTSDAGYSAVDGWWTIAPATSYASITQPVDIDGSTQPGFVANTAVAPAGLNGTQVIEILPADPTIQAFGFSGGSSGSRLHGVTVSGYHVYAAAGITITGSYIGVDPTGTTLRTVNNNVIHAASSGNVIGGIDPADRNVIVGNTPMYVSGPDTVVQGNLIGVNAGASTALVTGSRALIVRSNDALVGGTSTGAANVIASTSVGVNVDGGDRNSVVGNDFSLNPGQSIDLSPVNAPDGPTPNDAGDVDTGPNGYLNTPEIVRIIVGPTDAVVEFDLDVAAGDHLIEFYDDRTPLTTATITHPGGEVRHTVTIPLPTTTWLSATATVDTAGDLGATSEPSTVATVRSFVEVNSTGDASDALVGDGLCDTGGFNTAGAPECTLRAALEELDVLGGTIRFDIPTTELGHSGGVWTITPTTPLPTVAAPTMIDGTTHPDWVSTPVIAIDGSSILPTTSDGFVIAAGAESALVDGLSLISMPTRSIRVTGGTDVTIRRSHLGVDATGTATGAGGSGAVVYLSGGTDTSIGEPGAGNVIAGGQNGIVASGSGVDGLRIRDNRIGVDITGLSPLPITFDAVRLDAGVRRAEIGGSGTDDGNVLAAGQDGVQVDDETTDGVVIEGNLIGVGIDGTTPLSIGGDGIFVWDGGDDIEIRDNVIGNVGLAGIEYQGASSGGVIQGNHIGVDTSGNPHPIQENGVLFDAAGSTTDVLVGGTGVGEGNVIANTGAGGVFDGAVGQRGTGSIAILGNSIVGNTGLGIDLGTNGVDANDPLDSDTGSNDLLNFPVITSATESAGTVTIDLTLDVPAGDYRIEAFTNASGADPSGHGEGETFVGTTTVTHDGSGSASFSFTAPGTVGDVLALTATEDLGAGAFGATSEFSAVATVTAPDPGGAFVVDDSVRRTDVQAFGGLDPTATVTGATGPATALDGTTQRLVGPALPLDGAFTISARVRLDAWGDDPRLVAVADSAAVGVLDLFVDSATAEVVVRIDVGGGWSEYRAGPIGLGAWHDVVVTWDGTVLGLSLDGVDAGGVAPVTGPLRTDIQPPVVVGNTADTLHGLDGALDQVEIHGVARSAEWIAARRANVVDGGFVSVGSVQTSAADSWSTTASARTGGFALLAPDDLSGTDAWATAVGIDEPGIEFESWWFVDSPGSMDIAGGTRTGATPVVQHEASADLGSWSLAALTSGGRTVVAGPSGSVPAGTWTQVVVRTDEAGAVSLVVDGTEILAPTVAAGEASGSVGLRAGTVPLGAVWAVDDVQLRRFVSDEPTTSLGAIDRR